MALNNQTTNEKDKKANSFSSNGNFTHSHFLYISLVMIKSSRCCQRGNCLSSSDESCEMRMKISSKNIF